MILCTGCGRKNDDDSRFCEACGRKLQSSRSAPTSSPTAEPLGPFEHKGMPPKGWADLAKLAEAWAYLALLLAVGGACLYLREWWPLYPAVGLLALVAVVRKI